MKNSICLIVQKATEEEPLSLEERMHLLIREKSELLSGGNMIVFLIFILLPILLVIVSGNNSLILEQELTEESLEELRENTNIIMYVSLGLFAFFGIIALIEKITSKKQKKKYNELIDGFIRKSYLINFETAIPKGANKVEKILNEAIKVFPELKETKREAEKKGNKLHYEINRKISNSVYDLSLKTKSDGFFLVKFLEEQTYEELEKIVKNTNSYFKDDRKVFRLICVGTDFQNVFQDYGFEERMNNLRRKFKLDLIEELDKGYSVVWID